VAVLVNRETAGAPEALAAVLRQTGAGLILGGKTAGAALIAKEYTLKNGDRLWVANAPVHLGDGSNLSGGIKPDIAVEVSTPDERAYFADAFKPVLPANFTAGSPSMTNRPNGTNAPRRPRLNEAELVREHREGLNLDYEGSVPRFDTPASRDSEPEKPLVRDPALARALDLLKGLAVVRQAHS
jgi:hypothetical protein